MENLFGYDIICLKDRIEFAMEMCKEPKKVEEEEK